MLLTDDAVAVLSPCELRALRKELAGWTLRRLSQEARISVTQLSQYECGRNGLRRDQVELCERLLLRAAGERQQMIAKLFEAESAESMATTS